LLTPSGPETEPGAGPLEVGAGQPFVPPTDDRSTTDDDRPPDETAAESEAPPVLPVDELPGLELVTEQQIHDLLVAQGALLHGLVALDKGSEEWVWLQHELDAITGPLVRIANRYDVLRRVAAHADPLPIGMALLAYTQRSLAERGRVQAEHASEPAEPSGQADWEYAGPAPTQPPV
jgi:hypothetical protein